MTPGALHDGFPFLRGEIPVPVRSECQPQSRGLPDGSRLTDEDNFIYGGALTLELSAYVTDKIVLLVNGRQRVLFGGDCGKFHTQVGVGIRFMIR